LLKKLSCIMLILVVLLSTYLSSPVHANTNLGTLSTWNAYNNTGSSQLDQGYYEIARWQSAPNTMSIVLDGFTSTNFTSYVNHARNGWRNAGISINSTTSSSAANFKIYGGSYEELVEIDWRLQDGWKGITNYNDSTFEGTWTYSGDSNTRYGLKQNSAIVCVVWDTSYTANNYNSVTTHEFGHALGWRGHSSMTLPNSVMFWNPSGTSLTSNDKDHLTQIY